MFLEKVKIEFAKLNIPPEQVKPCSENEITELEKSRNIKLPGAYREFLLWVGHDAGDFLKGSHWQYEHLENIHKWAEKLLKENNFSLPLPRDAFIFYMHQGYQFRFFKLSEGDDPPIYHYYEGSTVGPKLEEFELFHPHLSDHLLAEIDADLNYEKELVEAIDQIKKGEYND